MGLKRQLRPRFRATGAPDKVRRLAMGADPQDSLPCPARPPWPPLRPTAGRHNPRPLDRHLMSRPQPDQRRQANLLPEPDRVTASGVSGHASNNLLQY